MTFVNPVHEDYYIVRHKMGLSEFKKAYKRYACVILKINEDEYKILKCNHCDNWVEFDKIYDIKTINFIRELAKANNQIYYGNPIDKHLFNILFLETLENTEEEIETLLFTVKMMGVS